MIDLKHNRKWSWTDGTPTDYFYWTPGEPDNDGDGYCVQIYTDYHPSDPDTTYRWNDYECDQPMRSFVCKRPAS